MTETTKTDLSSVSGIKQFIEKLGHSKAVVTRFVDRAVKENIPARLFSIVDTKDHINAKFVGSTGDTYTISIQVQHIDNSDTPDWADFVCSCPQAIKTKGLCKHSVAALLRRIPPQEDGTGPAPMAVEPAQIPDPVPAAATNTTVARGPIIAAGSRMLPSSFKRDSPPPPAKLSRKSPSQEPEEDIKIARPKPKQSRRGNGTANLALPAPQEDSRKRWMTSGEMLAGSDEALLEQCRRAQSSAAAGNFVQKVKKGEDGGGYARLPPQQKQEERPLVAKQVKVEIDLTADDEEMEEQRESKEEEEDVSMAAVEPPLPQPTAPPAAPVPNTGVFSFMSLIQYDDSDIDDD